MGWILIMSLKAGWNDIDPLCCGKTQGQTILNWKIFKYCPCYPINVGMCIATSSVFI